jgi:DNA-binding response OmpR family regulator
MAMAGTALKKKKIIIVDDDRETREMLKMALELEGYEVSQAANGLRLISTLHVDRPDLILLDVMMSWIDGFELCRAVKKNEEFNSIPVIFISAKKTASDIRTGLAAGAADYFSKPIDMERLLARIAALVESAPAATTPSGGSPAQRPSS